MRPERAQSLPQIMYETEQKEEMLRELLAQEQINMHTLTLSQFSLE